MLKIQEMLHFCSDHIKEEEEEEGDDSGEKEEEKKDDDETKEKDGEGKEKEKLDNGHQAFAVIGIALIAMGEDVGSEMVIRTFNHLVR